MNCDRAQTGTGKVRKVEWRSSECTTGNSDLRLDARLAGKCVYILLPAYNEEEGLEKLLHGGLADTAWAAHRSYCGSSAARTLQPEGRRERVADFKGNLSSIGVTKEGEGNTFSR